MPNRTLTPAELISFLPILERARKDLADASHGDTELLWALRRKLSKELAYDERGKPGWRRRLKHLKRKEQGGLCACGPHELPEAGAVLDRFSAMEGYTAENTRLLCPACDTRIQRERGYA